MQVGAVADIHGNFDALTRAMERHPTCRSGSASAIWPAERGAYPEPPRRSTGSRATTRTSIASRRGRRASRAAQPALHSERHGGRRRTADGRRSRRHLRADVVRHAGGAAAARRPKGRQAAAFRARGSEACKQLARCRHPDDARSGAPVHRRAGGGARQAGRGASTRASRRSTTCSRRSSRACTSAAIITGSSRRREGVRSVCIDRINRSYLLIDAGTLEYRKVDQG